MNSWTIEIYFLITKIKLSTILCKITVQKEDFAAGPCQQMGKNVATCQPRIMS